VPARRDGVRPRRDRAGPGAGGGATVVVGLGDGSCLRSGGERCAVRGVFYPGCD